MNRDTKKLEYIKKVWEDRDGAGKGERYATVPQVTNVPTTWLIR